MCTDLGLLTLMLCTWCTFGWSAMRGAAAAQASVAAACESSRGPTTMVLSNVSLLSVGLVLMEIRWFGQKV